MGKERFLTVLVPIKDKDCEATVYASLADLNNVVTPSAANTNKIYKTSDGTYYRSLRDPSSGVFGYNAVTEREFPYLGDPLTIYDFTYDATRMGSAPTISAQNVMRYAEKDGTDDVTLEGLWTQECHVVFNGERFYLKRIPTSSKTNEDARYKYDLDFVAERVILERVYLYDVVLPFSSDRPVSENSTFSFYGDINEMAKRINANLIRSGLASLTRKYVNYENHPSIEVPYLTFEQWNTVNTNAASLIPSVFATSWYAVLFVTEIYKPLGGNYNAYLMQYIYENDGNNFTISGYKCVIGKDKMGDTCSSEEKLLSFENDYINDALKEFHDTFELDYYITRGKDSNGQYNGDTLIVVGDCDYDFADWDDETEDYVRDDNGLPMTESPFDYGSTNELLSKEKTNTTDKIVTRITGVGSSENIPWYYPNPTPDGWIKPALLTNGVEKPSVDIPYPLDEGSTPSEYTTYEKYLKNRIGQTIRFGSEKLFRVATEYDSLQEIIVTGSSTKAFYVEYGLFNRTYVRPRLTLSMFFPQESMCSHFSAYLLDRNGIVESYNSSTTYQNPTQFQAMCMGMDGKSCTEIQPNKMYIFKLEFFFSQMPYSERYDYEGYHYSSESLSYDGDTTDKWIVRPSDGQTYHHTYNVTSQAYIGENFYQFENLSALARWSDVEVYDESNLTCVHTISPTFTGYSANGENFVAALPRRKNGKYKDVSTGVIYRCDTDDANDPSTGEPNSAFTANPTMGYEEWVVTYLTMRLRLFEAMHWFIGNEQVELSDYGLGIPTIGGQTYIADIFDTIDFRRVKYLTPQQRLMPEVYIKTDGERRFYDAHNYWDSDNGSLYLGTADAAIGEEQVDAYVRNPIYKEKETDEDSKHYKFENEYIKELPHEHIENFDDLKPTIKEQRNTVGGEPIRIDVAEAFGYDLTDNDEIWESADEGGKQGEYKHPYFFAKLRPMGFNIFDLALQDDMVISMTTGNCGACNFKIGVDETTKKNPVQVWAYDVYKGEWDSKEKLYSQGDLRRYIDLTGLYYDTNGSESGYVLVNSSIGYVNGGERKDTAYGQMYTSYGYSVEDVSQGKVGTTRKNGSLHFEGDVVTSGRFVDSQQDTAENYVWVALMKDTETYGVVMPSAKQNYNDPLLNQYIRPKSIEDVHTQSSTYEDDEEKADKFVLLNIVLPQIYLRRAEMELSHKLVEYMKDNNFQKFNFSIRFSRIFLAQSPNTDENLTENSVVYVKFNQRAYRQYVKHYVYKMSRGESLPEISIDLNDELQATMTLIQRQERSRRQNDRAVSNVFVSLEQKINESSGSVTEYNTTINEQTLEWGNF